MKYCTEKQNQGAKKSAVERVNCERPSYLSSHPFLRSLQRQLEAFRADSDSESDTRALQHCLGRKLQHEGNSSIFGESELESTLRELNVAFLAINTSSDASCDDAGFARERYGQWSESYRHQSRVEESQREEKYDKDGSVSDVRLSDGEDEVEGTGDIQSKEDQSYCGENYLVRGYVSDDERFDEESGIEGTGAMTARNDFMPEFCTTLQLTRCPKERKPFQYRDAEAISMPRKQLFQVADSTEQSDGHSGIERTEDVTTKTGFKSDFCNPSQLKRSPNKRKPFMYRKTEAPADMVREQSMSINEDFSDSGNSGAVASTTNKHHYHQQQLQTSKMCTQDTLDNACSLSHCNHSKSKHTSCDVTGKGNGVPSGHQPGIVLTTSSSSLKSTRRDSDMFGESNKESRHEHTQCKAFIMYKSAESVKHGDTIGEFKNGDRPCELNKNDYFWGQRYKEPHQTQPLSGHGKPESPPHTRNKNGDPPNELNKNDYLGSKRNRQLYENKPRSGLTKPKSPPYMGNKNGDSPGDFSGKHNRHNQNPSLKTREKISDLVAFSEDSGSLGGHGRKPHQTYFSLTMPQSPGRRLRHQLPQHLASSCPTVLSIAEEYLYQDLETGVRLIERRCPSLARMSR